MRDFYCGIAVCLGLAASLPAQIVITPSGPTTLSAGESVRLTANRQVVWSLAPGSKGSIDENGVYKASSEPVLARQQVGGCQLLPNDHIFNTRIDSLPLHARSAEWISMIRAGNTAARVNYLHSFPINYVNESTLRKNHLFLYTPGNNGEYWDPQPPDVKYQAGAYIDDVSHIDRHLLSLNRSTCEFEEIYNPGDGWGSCRNCTAASGMKYNTMQYGLPVRGGTDAAGMPLYPVTLRVDEIEQALRTGGSINHMLRMTLTNRFIRAAHVWPASSNAILPWGQIPYGTIFRLKKDFVSQSANPVTQLLIRQMKEYGLILSDGGLDLQVVVEDNIKMPPQIQAAFTEMLVGLMVTPEHLEIVDQSALLDTPGSGAVKPGNPFVEPADSAVVIATDARDPSVQARVRIALRGVTAGFASVREFVQAGTARQLEVTVHGAEDKTVVWTMDPPVEGATLSDTGLFTPPAELGAPVATVIRATSNADPRVAAQMTLIVLPSGTLRLAAGAQNYRDENGDTWWAWTTLNGVREWVNGIDSGHNYSCCQWPSYPDVALYRDGHFGYQDFRARFTVPDGDYKVTARMTESQRCPTPCRQHLEVNGRIVHRAVNLAERSGGINMPLDLDMPATVTGGGLTVAVRGMAPAGYHTKLSGLKIERVEAKPELRIEPAGTPTLTAGRTHRMYAVGWYMPDDVVWEVVSGPGTIGQDGVYEAPRRQVETAVVVRATSVSDPEKKAEATIRLTFGAMSISPVVTKISRTKTQQFTALVQGVNYEDVVWRLEGPGQLSETGLYTAPDELDRDTEVTVTVVSRDDENQLARLKFIVPEAPEAVRINAGGTHCGRPFTDALGRFWDADSGWTGQTATYSFGNPEIAGTTRDLMGLYWCSRYAGRTNDFEYNFAMPNGRYRVTLMWAEYRTADQGYKFDVVINGERVLTDFNFVQAAGGVRIAHNRTFETSVTNRNLKILFDGKPGAGEIGASINAIEIVPVPRQPAP